MLQSVSSTNYETLLRARRSIERAIGDCRDLRLKSGTAAVLGRLSVTLFRLHSFCGLGLTGGETSAGPSCMHTCEFRYSVPSFLQISYLKQKTINCCTFLFHSKHVLVDYVDVQLYEA